MLHKSTLVAAAALGLAGSVAAVPLWGQCGGQNYTGSTVCDAGSVCTYSNPYYSQCLPAPSSSSARPPSSTVRTTSTSSVRPPSSSSSVRTTSTSSVRPVSSSSSTVRPVSSSSVVQGNCGAFGNPYESGYTPYLSPYYVAEVNAAIAGMSSATLKAKAAAVAKIPNFTWFDVAAKVPVLSDYLADAKSQQTGGKKMIVQIVIYDLPNRDCHAKASNGEYLIANNGVNNYKAYINAISAAISAYPDVRVVAVVEPDSLANLVTNLSDQNCANAQAAYMECTKYALTTLKQCNIWLYLDAGHAGWLGWPANIDPAAKLFADLYKSVPGNRVKGLATNVANYNALSAATPDPIVQSNPNTDELKYITALAPKLSSNGFPATFIVDQGRSGVQNIRDEWGNWCNIAGAGFGLRPGPTSVSSAIDQIVWIKPGGECDGTSDTSAVRYDSTCGLPDAKKPAPEAGQWFEAYFEDLLTFANPPL